MARLVVQGGKPLQGSIPACGAKNAALPIIAASILARGEVVLERVPDISDVWVMSDILRAIGVKVEFEGKARMLLDSSKILTTTAPDELVRKMNASFDVAGPLLACYGEARVSLPGGCRLGPRPVDLHLEGFRKLGAEILSEGGFAHVRAAGRLQGAHIRFPKVSVGATKNCLMAATMAEGVTMLENCAREPEIGDLADFLVKMGASIEGIGTSRLRIHGVERLHGATHTIVADRIETGTYLIGGALTGGDVTLTECEPEHVAALLDHLREAGQEVTVGDRWVRVRGGRPIRALDVSTAPYPGFPTDLHPQLVSLLCLAEGTSTLQENIFSGRFMYVMELVRLGAKVKAEDRHVVVKGVNKLSGAPVDAPDIRAGGGLVLAALVAEGETVISGVEFVDRGYQDLEQRLSALGAEIERVQGPLPQVA
ncbi:UDP-N-acetylglucosamine 1-carboxyvinyltransferase [bacterium CPR1]|nr:UDP-N-acetylglucosamine 1-carboxyvinyltransferase [bacterium CPR1]